MAILLTITLGPLSTIAQDIPRIGTPELRDLTRGPESSRRTGPRFLLSERAIACTDHGWQLPAYATACPSGPGFRPLGNLHAAQSVFVTLQNNSDNDNSAFVVRLANIIENDAPDVTLVVLTTTASWRRTPSLHNRPRVQNLPLAEESDLWPQDFMEFGVIGRHQRTAAWDLEYSSSRYNGNDVPSVITHSCSEGIFHLRGTLRRSHSGNHGGNIEALAGGIVAVGSSMDEGMVNSLTRQLRRPPLVLDTSWLDVGHVDEFVTVIPSERAPCGFAILHASPIRAWGIIRSNPTLSVGISARGMSDRLDAQAGIFVRRTSNQILWSSDFSAARELADRRISTAISQVSAALEAATGCSNIASVAFPVVFHRNPESGLLQPLNPNPVNLLMVGNTAIVPAQFHAGFEQDIIASLRAHGIKTRFIDDRFFHAQGGNVHCATQVLRRCR